MLNHESRSSLLYDLPASIVVFFVGLPLCIGVALASGAPIFSGLLAGILGAVVAGLLSGSSIAVTGPAAGMASVVLIAARDMGTFDAVLTALVMAGVLQVIFGYLKLGVIGHFFPSSVISGMIAGIGLLLILKQIPHALGDDADYIGDLSFFQEDKQNTFTEIYQALRGANPGAIFIFSVCIFALAIFDMVGSKKKNWASYAPAPLIAVILGLIFNEILKANYQTLALKGEHLVKLPEVRNLSSIFASPDWSVILDKQNVFLWAILLALVASLESLLVIEASDKLDPSRRITPVNRELKAQGITNVICGLLGALPVTAVIIRTSANINAGARTKVATISHGIILTLAIFVFPGFISQIPLACLAAILIMLGYKLTSPQRWREILKKGKDQFIPFSITAAGIVFTNLFAGVFIGLLVSIVFILKSNYHSAVILVNNGNSYLMKFTRDVSFFNKSALVKSLEKIPENSTLLIEGSSIRFIDHDIIELLSDFQRASAKRNISVVVKRTNHALHPFFKTIHSTT